jgi:20S proteasome alpha/beta subunit
MTLTVGIIAKDGFVLASDSRQSNNMSINDTVEKIIVLSDNISVGIAGDGNLASHIFDIIKRDNKLELNKGIHSVAEQLQEELSKTFDKYYPNSNCKDRDELHILLAGYSLEDPPIPHLYILMSEDNFIPRQSPAGHNSIGFSHISQYILNRIYEKGKITSKQAAKLSVFCIRETMMQTKSVGGQIKVGIFSEKNKFSLLSKPTVNNLYTQCKQMQDFQKYRFYPEDTEGSDLFEDDIIKK